MRSERHDDRLDAAIDAAARSLTAAEPSPALRAAVREHIGRRQRASWLVPATAVAAVLVGALVGQMLSDPSIPGHMEMPDLPAKPRLHVLVTVPMMDVDSLEIHQLVAESVLPAVDIVEAPPSPEPSIPPITIEPLETRQIAVDTSSGVMPIEIEPLQIEPLQGE